MVKKGKFGKTTKLFRSGGRGGGGGIASSCSERETRKRLGACSNTGKEQGRPYPLPNGEQLKTEELYFKEDPPSKTVNTNSTEMSLSTNGFDTTQV